MFRMWVKEWKDRHLLKDIVVTRDSSENRTRKVLSALEYACAEFDLQPPIWLDKNIRDFQRHAKTRFSKDSFIEDIPFDFLEIQMLEED